MFLGKKDNLYNIILCGTKMTKYTNTILVFLLNNNYHIK